MEQIDLITHTFNNIGVLEWNFCILHKRTCVFTLMPVAEQLRHANLAVHSQCQYCIILKVYSVAFDGRNVKPTVTNLAGVTVEVAMACCIGGVGCGVPIIVSPSHACAQMSVHMHSHKCTYTPPHSRELVYICLCMNIDTWIRTEGYIFEWFKYVRDQSAIKFSCAWCFQVFPVHFFFALADFVCVIEANKRTI